MSGFKYDKHDRGINRRVRNSHDKLYPIYQSIKPDLKMLSSSMLEVEKEFAISENNDIRLELDQIVNICRRIIYKYLGNDILSYFDEMIKQDHIIFYDEDAIFLRGQYDKGYGYMHDFYYNVIYIPLKNNIIDIYSLLHEFIHSIQLNDKNIMASELLAEVGPIFMEFLVLDYLTEITGNDPDCYNNFIERIIDNYNVNYSINNNIIDEDSIYTYNSYSYDIAMILSIKMFKNYLKDKENYLANFKKYIVNVGEVNFNTSMKILGINIKYINGKLKYSDILFEDLINNYEEYVKIVEKKDIKLFNNNKVKIKG